MYKLLIYNLEKLIFILCSNICIMLHFSCTSIQQKLVDQNHFPTSIEIPASLPSKENFHLYILAGQSNMAGRGFVQPSDTIPDPRILTLTKKNSWVLAKEPLHYYEPTRTGLDCGLAFARSLLKHMDKNTTIGLIPCAVGGSSVEQWLYDSTYRSVTLYSNFIEKVNIAKSSGTIKGILWHQGESNSGIQSQKQFKIHMTELIQKMRSDIGIPDLPFYAGLIGSFLKKETFPQAQLVNDDLRSLSQKMKNMYIIETADLKPKPDTVHFDTGSIRILGERYARMVRKNKSE